VTRTTTNEIASFYTFFIVAVYGRDYAVHVIVLNIFSTIAEYWLVTVVILSIIVGHSDGVRPGIAPRHSMQSNKGRPPTLAGVQAKMQWQLPPAILHL